jgi:hypothetical protein
MQRRPSKTARAAGLGDAGRPKGRNAKIEHAKLRPRGEPADLSPHCRHERRVVVDKSDEYRRKAEYCERKAVAAPNEIARAEWLQLATLWRQMIRPKDALKDDQQ